MQQKKTTILFVLFDFIAAFTTWFLFFNYRKLYIEQISNYQLFDTFELPTFWYGAIVISLFWLTLFAVLGMYKNVFRKSRLKEFAQTLSTTLLGCILLFFVVLIDDFLLDYTFYYQSFFVLFCLQFVLSFTPKLILTSIIAHKVHSRKIGFNSIVIGCNNRAYDLVKRLNAANKSEGYHILGFVTLTPQPKGMEKMQKQIQHLGGLDELGVLLKQFNVEDLIIAVQPKNMFYIHQRIAKIYHQNIHLKLLPEQQSLLTGNVKMNSILHEALIDLNLGRMAVWQKTIKRFLDVFISSFILLVFSPLYLLLAILVKKSSKGPVFFKQERIGYKAKPFKIIKFRTMYVNAEKDGPALSKDNDSRITKIGMFLRKSRMDELPQFYNVLIGEMSIVGPRPERAYFIEKISERAPEYHYLHCVKPGITSWGQVKYGYAENVDQMLDRLRFDLIYLENRSLLVDFKIMIHTVLVVIQGRGK